MCRAGDGRRPLRWATQAQSPALIPAGRRAWGQALSVCAPAPQSHLYAVGVLPRAWGWGDLAGAAGWLAELPDRGQQRSPSGEDPFRGGRRWASWEGAPPSSQSSASWAGRGGGGRARHTPEGRCKSSTPECVRKEATGLAHTHAHPHPSITPRRAQGGKGRRCGSQTGSLLWCSHPCGDLFPAHGRRLPWPQI